MIYFQTLMIDAVLKNFALLHIAKLIHKTDVVYLVAAAVYFSAFIL